MTDANPANPVFTEARSLIDAVLDGRVSIAQEQRLQELACDHDVVASLYYHLLLQECVVAAHSASSGDARLPDDDSTDDATTDAFTANETMILPALRLRPDTPEQSSLLAPPLLDPSSPPEPGQASFARRHWLGLAAAVLVTAGVTVPLLTGTPRPGPVDNTMTGQLAGRPTAPAAPVIATIVDEHDVRWEGTDLTARIGAALPTTEVTLLSGVVGIAFAGGATVIVEAPARFTVDGPGRLSLATGRLAATVPPVARGFTVATPSALVVDLGTEFGIDLRSDGGTDVAVFKGQVRAATPTGMAPQLLNEGAAATVVGNAVTVDPAGAVPQRYIRSFSGTATSLDLVDLIAGGDGTTNRRSVGVDMKTGRLVTASGDNVVSDRTYHKIESLPVLDGCFIPVGSVPEQVDSAGNTFTFPPTRATSFNVIWAGGPVAPIGGKFTARLGDVDYSLDGHSYMFMHSNKGLTFDLNAVRRLHPGATLTRFRSTAGNSPANNPQILNAAKSDLRVIVDGRLRASHLQLLASDGPLAINVPLVTTDRFLTLAATDGGDAQGGDWLMWGDPKIDLARPEPASK